MSSKPKIAVIGCGYWGKNIVRTANDIGNLKTVIDANQKLQKDFKSKYNTDYQWFL